MKIFLSHSGKDKSFVREVVQGLPKFLKTHEILWGEKLSKSLRKAIKTESDFVIVFIDRDALESSWVQKEITWALEQEAQLKREFLLPILVDNIDEKPEWLNEKVYLVLQDQEEYSVKVLCEKIVLNLFNLLANSWEKSKAKTSLGRGDVAMSSMIECDLVEFIADRTQGPYSNPRWLDEFQEQHPDGKIEIFVIARTAKWWYELISQQKVKHLSKFDIHILASDPTVDRRLLAPDDRREFSTDIAFFPNKFAYLERKLENLSYAHAPALVLDSFTFVRSGNDKIVILDLYTGAGFDGPRPQIVFRHKVKDMGDQNCILERLGRHAVNMWTSGGKHISTNEAKKIAQAFQRFDEEPSRRDSPERLANHAISIFSCYEKISNAMEISDEGEFQGFGVPAPVCAQIEITDYCISTRCLGCSRGNKRKKEQMSYQMFTSIVNDLSQMGNRSIVLSGGEPLIHPHIIEFLDFAAKLNMSIAVLTDGLAITSHNNLSEVMGRTVSSIRISIDGFTAEAYRKVRKVNHTLGDPIERLEKAMTLLSKAKQEKGAKLKHIGVCVTLYEKNVDEINAAIDWVSSHKMIDSLVFKFAHGTTDTISNTVNPYICSEKNVKDAIGLIERRAEDIVGNQEINVDYMRKYVGKMGVEAISSGKPTLEMYESGDVICFTPLLFSLVDASGGVYICCHTYYDNSDEHPDRLSFCMGSVKVNQKSYRDIWRETAFERVMKTHKWDTEKGTLICNCNMRDECTRHWKNNELFADAYRSYCQASLTGRQLIANEIQQFADASAQPFWM